VRVLATGLGRTAPRGRGPAGAAVYAPAVPLVLVVPTAVLILVAGAAWRLDRRLRHDVARLAGSADRLASLREAVAALGTQVDEARRRHDDLARR
jgi:hypothetical protein